MTPQLHKSLPLNQGQQYDYKQIKGGHVLRTVVFKNKQINLRKMIFTWQTQDEKKIIEPSMLTEGSLTQSLGAEILVILVSHKIGE